MKNTTKRSAMFFLIVFAVLVSLVIIAHTDLYAQQSLPGGSYSKTCRNCSMEEGPMLRCECSYKNKYSGTTLYTGLCEPNTVWNNKSKLKCTPKGSFKKSCGSISWNQTRLQAVCKTKKGKASGTTLPNWPGCDGDIANCDGKLTCGPCS